MSDDDAILTGKLPNDFANKMADVIHHALQRGMEPDEVCGVAVGVIADFARYHYGNAHLKELARVIQDRRNRPMPKVEIK